MAEANCYWIRFCQPIDNHMVCHLCAILFAYIRSVNTIFFRRFCRLACLCLELDCYVRVVNRYFMWFVFFSRSGGEVCCDSQIHMENYTIKLHINKIEFPKIAQLGTIDSLVNYFQDQCWKCQSESDAVCVCVCDRQSFSLQIDSLSNGWLLWKRCAQIIEGRVFQYRNKLSSSVKRSENVWAKKKLRIGWLGQSSFHQPQLNGHNLLNRLCADIKTFEIEILRTLPN